MTGDRDSQSLQPSGGSERIVALGFSPDACSLLRRLQQSGRLAAVRWPSDRQPAATWLEQEWQIGRAHV